MSNDCNERLPSRVLQNSSRKETPRQFRELGPPVAQCSQYISQYISLDTFSLK